MFGFSKKRLACSHFALTGGLYSRHDVYIKVQDEGDFTISREPANLHPQGTAEIRLLSKIENHTRSRGLGWAHVERWEVRSQARAAALNPRDDDRLRTRIGELDNPEATTAWHKPPEVNERRASLKKTDTTQGIIARFAAGQF